MAIVRRQFLKTILMSMAPLGGVRLKDLEKMADELTTVHPLPVLFIGHGSPMNALDTNTFTSGWKKIRQSLPAPKAILCISAHWLTKGSFVSMTKEPSVIYDFYGFPKRLYEVTYPAPGAPEFADMAVKETTGTIQPDHEWGVDHGTWSVLKQMYPEANIPTFQLSIDYHQPPAYHYKLATQLKKLRSKGILIIGSGNIVHNLQMMKMEHGPYNWASEFDETIKKYIDQRSDDQLIRFHDLGEMAKLAVPTPDHYYPLLYTLGLTEKSEAITHYCEKVSMASISMRSIKIG